MHAARLGKSIERGTPEHLSCCDTEHTRHIHKRVQSRFFQTENGPLLARFVNHGILEKCQRRKRSEAIIGGDVQKLAADGIENVRFQLPA